MTENLLDGLKNKVYNSNFVKLTSGNSYANTPYGGNFIPEDALSDSQKRFSTLAPIPNYPKPETMFYVYFSLNKNTYNMISQRKELVEYLSRISSSEPTTDLNISNALTNQESRDDSIMASISDGISAGISTITKSFNDIKNTVADAIGIPNLDIAPSDNQSTVVDYIPDIYIMKQLAFELSKFVISANKPKITFETTELNEYNRTRVVYKKQKFNELNLTFYDVKENPIQQFFFTYLKIISNSFLSKNHNNFNQPINNTTFDTTPLDDFGLTLDSGFKLIDRISIIDFYMDKMMVYTMEAPTITNIDFGNANLGSWKPNQVKVSFKYEGLTNSLLDVDPYITDLIQSNKKEYLSSMINSSINEDIAAFVQKNYLSGQDLAVDTSVAFLKGLLDSANRHRYSPIQDQLLDIGRKMGFAEEINLLVKAKQTIEEYDNDDTYGKYILSVLDDPTSVIGRITNSGSQGMNAIKNLF